MRRPLEPTDEYAPELARTGGEVVRDLTARRFSHRPSSSHADMMAEYYAAREAWLWQREAYAIGYATEEAEFAMYYPRPLLRDFMKARSQQQPDEGVASSHLRGGAA